MTHPFRAVFFSATCLAGLALAQAPSGSPPFGPPPEAITACKGLTASTACTVTTPDGKSLTGTCETAPDGSTLACRPQGGPPGGHHGVPKEAVTSCSGLTSGTACSFTTTDGKNVTGTCATPPEGSGLACKPEGAGPGGHHGPPPFALAACKGLSSGASCTITTPDGQSLPGTCGAPPSGGDLACRPSR